LAARVGAKYLFGFGVLCTSVLTMFTPAAAHHSVGMLLLVRILEGLGEVSFLCEFDPSVCLDKYLFRQVTFHSHLPSRQGIKPVTSQLNH